MKKNVLKNSLPFVLATVKAVETFAQEHDKIAAVTETGVLVGNQGNGLAKSGNKRLDWINEALAHIAPHRMAYFMTWSNFNETNFAQPYLVTPKRGHEMVNAFIRFYNSPKSIFAHQIPTLSGLPVKASAAEKEYGYVLSPSSMARILQPTQIRAKAEGSFKKAELVLRRKDGMVAASLPADVGNDGIVNGEITDAALQAAGKNVAYVELDLDGKPADSVMVLCNMPEPEPNPAMVDDFENYYGDGGLLKAAYSINCGAGCSVEPLLSQKHQGGETGLDFHYKINKGGYAGIIKSLKGIDWSAYDAVQFWVIPDGKGQKLIIQTNSNG